MSVLRCLLTLTRHFYRLWRAGQLRFRLETFGLYYPALPYQASPWRPSPRGIILLLRQMPSYARWVGEMEVIELNGPAAWWVSRTGKGTGLSDDWRRISGDG